MPKKIAILGTAPSSRLLAPLRDPEWEIWATSPPNMDLPRVDAWFEIHCDASIDELNMPHFVTHLQNHPRVYMATKTDRFPNAIVYPKDEILKEFDPYYMTSSASWMIAFAILQKPEEIGLWGIDMCADEEYAYQRPGCRELLKEAEKRGIKVTVPIESDLLVYPPLYGFSEFAPFGAKLRARKKELVERLENLVKRADELKAQYEQVQINKHYINGAIADLNYVIKNWT